MVSLPSGTATVTVQIIDSTAEMTAIPTSVFFQRSIQGFDTFKGRCYSFLITHTDDRGEKRRVVFDLGIRKDWKNYVPSVVEMLGNWERNFGFEMKVRKDVAEILGEKGVELEGIEAVILSHGHFDHIGNMQTFPSNVDLVVGPGIKEAYMPGWPEREVPLQESDFAGRNVREMSFERSNLKIDDFRAWDYFGDGSFYLLDAPGHAIGHMNALARTTTSPDTSIFLAGDSFHHPSELRPTKHVKLPRELDLPDISSRPCPCQIFENLQPRRPLDKPFVDPNESVSHNNQQALETIVKIQAFDADDNCFIVAAHDESLYPLMEYFPKQANSWKEKGWKDRGRWPYLNDFAEAVRVGMESKE